MAEKVTPLMQQYFAIKATYVDTLLLFQVGDFYEFFFDDAVTAASFLGIALTKRGKHNGDPIPLCGVPVHAIQHYIQKLVKGGFKVALCDQLEEARPGTVVKRGVTQVFTPGTLTDSALLSEKSSSYLVCLFQWEEKLLFLALELVTGQLYITQILSTDTMQLTTELKRFFPDEVIVLEHDKTLLSLLKKNDYYVSTVSRDLLLKSSVFSKEWQNQFDSSSKEYLQKNPYYKEIFDLLYAYLSHTHEAALLSCKTITFYTQDQFVVLDATTQKNLELVCNVSDGGIKHTLFWALDAAMTAMGSRLIKKWILRPLVTKAAIEKRQKIILFLVLNSSVLSRLRAIFSCVGDVERVVGRIALQKASFHDYLNLLRALQLAPDIVQELYQDKAGVGLSTFLQGMVDFTHITQLLFNGLNNDTTKDWIIKKGFSKKLDELRDLVHHSNKKVLSLEQEEQQVTGINSLKIRYNNIHGYTIEITKPNISLVPDRYQHVQTLVGKVRFVTPELQQLRIAIEEAKGTLEVVEKEIFDSIKEKIYKEVSHLRLFAHTLCTIDALCSFAYIAYKRGYVCPKINTGKDIVILQAKHPIVDQVLQESFIPNDIVLTDDSSLWIITGPNMGGKSTYLRQVALLTIMAHIGSFIPAKSADIALVDRIFTRIGAGDNLAEGKSTFLIEMEETATICQHATEHSLVILDEVGRGTSTFDGLAIAQSVVEYIYKKIKARCLFATHYHELTQLSNEYKGIVTYYMASKKTDEGIVFLYTMQPGVALGSFGIEVAKLAKLPKEIIIRSQALVGYFMHSVKNIGTTSKNDTLKQLIASNVDLKEEVRRLQMKIKNTEKTYQTLDTIDLTELSPKKALDLLWDIKEKESL